MLTSTRYLTPPQVAELLGVNPGKVIGWIRGGELRATNVAAKLTGRPRWRISPGDLAIFEQRRSAIAPAPKSRPRRSSAATVIEFF